MGEQDSNVWQAGAQMILNPSDKGITRDGFTLLATVGFTGARALEFKLAYLDAFNRMEAEVP